MIIDYPIYGYNAEDHICQIKQAAAQSERKESFLGEYSGLYECRSAHPEILFFTGQGILWWIVIFGACVAKYMITAKRKKVSFQSLQGSCAFEIVLGGAIFFILFLLASYFFGGSSPYYTSDVDAILYEFAIHPRFPSTFAVLYGVASLLQVVLIKNKKST
jgi:hypothetical protein